jgi:hypothetical protein
MEKTKRPDVELKERTEVLETLRQRLSSRGHKNARTADDFFSEFFSKNNIPLLNPLTDVEGDN